MSRSFKKSLAFGFSVVALLMGEKPAPAQSWNMYSGYTDTVTLGFIRTIPNPVVSMQTPTLNVSAGGGPTVGVTMDTGSTGMVLSSSYVNTAGLQPLGTGQIVYTSSNNPVSGTFYKLPVTINPAN